jgi:hypothetical protein
VEFFNNFAAEPEKHNEAVVELFPSYHEECCFIFEQLQRLFLYSMVSLASNNVLSYCNLAPPLRSFLSIGLKKEMNVIFIIF